MAVAPVELVSTQIVADMDVRLQERMQSLREFDITPQLAIITNNFDHAPTKKYVNLKDKVATRLGMHVYTQILPTANEEPLFEEIFKLNHDPLIDGMIVQLPLADPELTDGVLNCIKPSKDVDGLGLRARYPSATSSAIMRLLDGYGIDYVDQRVAILGKGRLVGAPLLKLMRDNGALHVATYDLQDDAMARIQAINEADVIISAMGAPEALTPDLFEDITRPRVLIDAGVAEQDGKLSGDVAPQLRAAALENGWQISAQHGGIGPLTIRTLLSHVVDAAEEPVSPFVYL